MTPRPAEDAIGPRRGRAEQKDDQDNEQDSVHGQLVH
jgi:hypothetical protein